MTYRHENIGLGTRNMSALNSAATQNSASHRLVSTIADLADIFEPGVQVCTWQRPIDRQVANYFAKLTSVNNLQLVETLQSNGRAQLADLPNTEGCEQLRNDVSQLGEILFELVDCSTVGLRYTQLERTMCPRWHVDRVPLRLLCTYEGPGTECLDNQHTARDQLASPDIANAACHRAATFDVVLLKGALWQDNEGLGAIHRSPAVPGKGRRTLVSLDPLWHA